jgi:organic radical activating enzyme
MSRTENLIKFKEIVLDSVSPSVCSAKWLETTMWLYDGVTASCHHNPSHKIQLDPNNPSSLHDTAQKINERKAMLAGKNPSGCNYCWDTEKAGSVSDRYKKSFSHKSDLFGSEKLNILTTNSKFYIDSVFSNPNKSSLLHLEIAFSRVCNLGCMYCGPYYSNTWANDIRVNGPYNVNPENKWDTRFEDPLLHIKDEADNPYIKAFFDWWPTLKTTLKTLRFTGGEPFLHVGMWKFLEEVVVDDSYVGNVMINSNLIHDPKVIWKFIDLIKTTSNVRQYEVHTSCESSLSDAEFIRDGFDGQLWWNNVNLLLEELPSLKLTVTTAINNISIWSYNEYIEMILQLRTKYGKNRINLNCNRVFNPTYQSVNIIDYDNRMLLSKMIEYSTIKLKNHNLYNKHDLDQLNSLIQYLQQLNVSTFAYSSNNSQEDFMRSQEEKSLLKFLSEYKNRRNKTEETLSQGFKDWIKCVRDRHEE